MEEACQDHQGTGSNDVVYNDIVIHEEAIIKKAKELGITEIITTG